MKKNILNLAIVSCFALAAMSAHADSEGGGSLESERAALSNYLWPDSSKGGSVGLDYTGHGRTDKMYPTMTSEHGKSEQRDKSKH